MTIDLAVLLTVFALVFVVELPDKTMVATLVLSSRYRPLPVLAGIGAAFALQMGIAVTIGGVLSLLPEQVTLGIVAALFAAGAVVLFRESLHDDEEAPKETPATNSPYRIALISFGILVIAEFGDGSQLATAAMSAKYGAPLSVFLGAWLAEMTVCTIAVVVGRALLKIIPVHWLQRVAAVIFTVFALLAVVQIVR